MRKPRTKPMMNGIAMMTIVGNPAMVPPVMKPSRSLNKSKGKIILQNHLALWVKLRLLGIFYARISTYVLPFSQGGNAK
jgi:hypothetical protein